MARVLPFRGYRYNAEKVKDPVAVVSPPYDVVSDELRRELHGRHPHNVIRLILGEDRPQDDATENRYVRARHHFQEWEKTGVIIRDPSPVFYVYEQEYPWRWEERRVRTGLIAAVGLEEYGGGVIYPHEQTFPGPKADRLRLMQALPVSLEQIFCFYPGPSEPIRSMLRRTTQEQPLWDFADEGSIRHRLWLLDDSAVIADLVMAFRDRPLFIADGHHRYESALTFREQMRHTDPCDGPDRAYHFVMTTLISIEDEGLTVLPTHRLVRTSRRPGEILAVLEPHFHIEERLLGDGERGIQKCLDEVEDRGAHAHVFGLYTGGDKVSLLTLKDPQLAREIAEAGHSHPRGTLDVVILERLVFQRLLNLGDAEGITFTPDGNVALQEVRSGRAHAAFFLNPIPAARIVEVVATGERLPPKSTYFYPKLLSGLVFFKIDQSEVLDVSEEFL
ncbi:MAG: DUF1015 domain-containing protein [Candidatus Methylomirabilales bacterium]